MKDTGDIILRLEHENEVMRKKIEELEAELEVWKRTATEYAGIVKELRRDMVGMTRIIYELWKGGK